MMHQNFRLGRGVLLGCAVLLLSIVLSACMAEDAEEATATPAGQASTPVGTISARSATPAGPAPTPAEVDAGHVTMIDEWRAVQVPQYPDSTRLDFEAESAAVVENAGTMLYGTEDSTDEVLAFYRGALPIFGWTEQSANDRQMLATHQGASLLISAREDAGKTQILMQLLDT